MTEVSLFYPIKLFVERNGTIYRIVSTILLIEQYFIRYSENLRLLFTLQKSIFILTLKL